MNVNKLVRPNILAMKAYSSAREEFGDFANGILLDANENPNDTDWNRYPDPTQNTLKEMIGKLKGVNTNQLFVGNGSDEAIDLVIRIFCEPGKDNIMLCDPTYGMYEVAAAIQNTEVKKVPLDLDFELIPAKVLANINDHTKIIFLCNPNNPTGNLLDPQAIKIILKQFKGIVVIDEAYIDFAKSESFIGQINRYENLIVLQTFSKAWGMAGLRLGTAFANEKTIRIFNKVKAPYNLNSFTQQEGCRQIQQRAYQLNDYKATNASERTKLIKALGASKEVDKVFPSDSNFILVKFNDPMKVFKALLEQNVIVRNRSKTTNCEGCLRITIGTPVQNNLIIETINTL